MSSDPFAEMSVSDIKGRIFERTDAEEEYARVVGGESDSDDSERQKAHEEFMKVADSVKDGYETAKALQAELEEERADRAYQEAFNALDTVDYDARLAEIEAENLAEDFGANSEEVLDFVHAWSEIDAGSASHFLETLEYKAAAEQYEAQQQLAEVQHERSEAVQQATNAAIAEALKGYKTDKFRKELSEVVDGIADNFPPVSTPEEAAQVAESAVRTAQELARARSVHKLKQELFASDLSIYNATSEDEADWRPALKAVQERPVEFDPSRITPPPPREQRVAAFHEEMTADPIGAEFLAELERNERNPGAKPATRKRR